MDHERQQEAADRPALTFSDLIFAVVLVLIPSHILVPENYVTNEVLHDSIGDSTAQLFGSAVAFGLIAVLWADHHRYLAGSEYRDTALFWGNLGFLGCIVLLAFPAATFTKHPGAPVAVLVFAGALVICAAVWGLLWMRARRQDAVLAALAPGDQRRIQLQALALPLVLVITAPLMLIDLRIRADAISVAVFAWMVGIPLARAWIGARIARP